MVYGGSQVGRLANSHTLFLSESERHREVRDTVSDGTASRDSRLCDTKNSVTSMREFGKLSVYITMNAIRSSSKFSFEPPWTKQKSTA